MKPRLYLETTIVSYFVARPSRDLVTAAHQQLTHDWWNERDKDFDLYISQLVVQEASAGDSDAVQQRLNFRDGFPSLQLTENALILAKALVDEKAVPEKAAGDALHIAIAAINGMDYLLTWNMKHLANAVLRNTISLVCRAHGYEPPVICTPEELLEK